MSNPFRSRVREALENLPIHTEDILPEVFQAATFFTDRYRDCDACRGSGTRYLPAPGSDPDECPSCLGGGVVPTDEAVEVVAKVWLPTMWWQFGADEGWGKESWDGASEAKRDSARDHARAALIALYMMEKE